MSAFSGTVTEWTVSSLFCASHLNLQQVINGNGEMQVYLRKMTDRQREILSNPSLYTGIAAQKAKAIASDWKEQLKQY